MKLKVSQIVGRDSPFGGQPERMIEFTLSEIPFRPVPTSEVGRISFEIGREMTSAMGLPFHMVGSQKVPKVVLILSDTEYQDLGMQFEVNGIYELAFSGEGNMKFTKVDSKVPT